MITKTIENFGGSLTRIRNGDMDSGLAKFFTSWGYDPYHKPGNLTWMDTPVRIDPSASVVTDMIVKFKQHIESSVDYSYAIGYAGNLYKITTSTDSPALVSATALNLKYGGGMDFYASATNEKIWIGHDAGLTKMAFDGTTPTSVGTFTANVPRPVQQFIGKLYIGDGSNIQEVDSTEAVSSAAKLSPGLPPNLQIQDLKITADGTRLKILARRVPAADIEAIDSVGISSNEETYVFYWNGTDLAVTSYETYPSLSGTAVSTFAQQEIVFGYDFLGSMFRTILEKPFSFNKAKSPLPNAIDSSSDVMFWAVPEAVGSSQLAALFAYGKLDDQTQGLFRLDRLTPSTQTNVNTVGALKLVSNLVYGTGGVQNTPAKFYFSTFETGTPNASKLYKLLYQPTVAVPSFGVYETQAQIFQDKVGCKQVRFYTEPTASGMSFQMDLIDSQGSVIPNSTFTYAFAGTAMDRIEFNPPIAPKFSFAIRVTNLGTANMTFKKIEMDIDTTEGN